MKKCNKCGEEKDLTHYSPNKTCKDGHVGTCKPCANERVSKWYKDNRARRQLAANKRNQERKSLVVAHFGDRCEDCHNSFENCVYEFHHLDPSKKDVNPSEAMTRSMSRMWEELDKCVMLCANCHRLRHFANGESLVSPKEGN